MNDFSADFRKPQQFSILLFAGLRDAMKCDRITVSVPQSTSPGSIGVNPVDENSLAEASLTVADLLSACAEQFPQLAAWLPHVRVAVNLEYSSVSTLLHAGDEIAFIPPVAGG